MFPFADIFAPSISPLDTDIFAKLIAPVALICAFVILFATIFAAVIELAAILSPVTPLF